MKLKTIICVALAAALSFTALGILTACGSKEDIQEGSNNSETLSLSDIANSMCSGVNVPSYEVTDLDEENFEYFAFIPYDNDYTAVQADGLANISAHSLVIIKNDAEGTADIAAEILEKADPRKWLCVEAESVAVVHTDHYIALVMSTKEITNKLIGNFKSLSSGLNDGEAYEYYK